MAVKTAQRLDLSSLSSGLFEDLVKAATSAPSGDNLQPWRFSRRGDVLLVHHDSGRDSSLYNVHGFASFVALGAAIENVVIAGSNHGLRAEVECFSDTGSDIIAEVRFAAGGIPDPLANSIPARCVNRRAYARRPLAPELADALEVEAQKISEVKLHWIQDPGQRKILGSLVMEADRLLLENPHLHAQLFSCLRWTADEVEITRDGLPVSTLELGKLGTKGFRALSSWPRVSLLNRFGLSRIAARHSLELIKRSSQLGLLTVPALAPTAFVKAGRAFERLWLAITSQGASLQPMTGFVFLQLRALLGVYDGLSPSQLALLERLRRDLGAIFSIEPGDIPAMLFRTGYGPPPSGRTVRRRAAEVFRTEPQGLP
jgi:nitroreductase